MSFPPWAYVQLLPRDSTMSISPDAGHGPYVSLTGSIQIAGQSQSPAGNFAVTSTLPYLIDALVLKRADLTGLTIVPFVTSVVATQLFHVSEEQVPSLSRLITVFFSIRAGSCRVGLMCNAPSWTKEFSSVLVVCSNCPLLAMVSVIQNEWNMRITRSPQPLPPLSTCLC